MCSIWDKAPLQNWSVIIFCQAKACSSCTVSHMVSTFRSTYFRINKEDTAYRLDRFFTLSHLSRTLTHIIGKKSGHKQNSHQCKTMFSCTRSLSLKPASNSRQFNQHFNEQLFSTFRSLYFGIDTEDTALRSNRFFTLSHMPRTSYMLPTIKIRLD